MAKTKKTKNNKLKRESGKKKFKSKHVNGLKKLNKLYNDKIPLNELFDDINNSVDSNSWFSIKESNKFRKINSLKFKDDKISTKIIKCKKLIILPTIEQKKILLKFMNAYRLMYNRTIKLMRSNWKNNKKTSTNFKYIRTYLLKNEKNAIRYQYNVPSHMLDGAIKLACASYKSAFSNYKNGNIKHFNIRYLKKLKKSHIFDIEKTAFNKINFYKTFIKGKLKNKEGFDYTNITCDCKLHYNTQTKRFTLLIPENLEPFNNYKNNDYISIDPGVRTFLNCLTNNNMIEISNNGQKHIKTKLLEIDKINNSTNLKNKKRAVTKRSVKIQNMVSDLHWKSINYLMKKNQTNIIIGIKIFKENLNTLESEAF